MTKLRRCRFCTFHYNEMIQLWAVLETVALSPKPAGVVESTRDKDGSLGLQMLVYALKLKPGNL